MTPKTPKRQPRKSTPEDIRRFEEMKRDFQAQTDRMMISVQPFIENTQRLLSSLSKKEAEPEMLFYKKPDPLSKEDAYELLTSLQERKTNGKSGKKQIELILSKKLRNISRADNPEMVYSLANAPKRFHLMEVMSEASQTTQKLADTIESTTDSVRTSAATINRKAKALLGLTEKLLIGSAGAGYHINPKFLLKKK